VKIDDLVAEIERICKELALKALEGSSGIEKNSMKYFDKALDLLKPRTSPEHLERYSEYENRK
jgi:SpoVK/Ycf46/Vps4 family AAA+-type ATPase